MPPRGRRARECGRSCHSRPARSQSTPSSRATRRARARFAAVEDSRNRTLRDSVLRSLRQHGFGIGGGSAGDCLVKGCRLAGRDQVADQGPDRDLFAVLGSSGGMRKIPVSRLSISWVALSPSRLKRGSPAATRWPSLLSQPTKVPSSMFQPSRGIVTSLAMTSFFHHSAMRSRIACAMESGVGHDGGFQAWAIGGRREGAVEPADRRVEIVETMVGQLGGDLGTDAARGERLVDDQQPAGLGDRATDRLDVERSDGPRIDQLDRDPSLASRSQTFFI